MKRLTAGFWPDAAGDLLPLRKKERGSMDELLPVRRRNHLFRQLSPRRRHGGGGGGDGQLSPAPDHHRREAVLCPWRQHGGRGPEGPHQRQTLTEPGLSGLSIGFIDDGAVYCPLATDTEKCYRVALDLSECTRVAIPREQRPTDYDALLDQIYAAVGAIDNRMALRTLRARYSETGSLTSLEMTVWSLQEETYSLNSWADVHVSVQRSAAASPSPPRTSTGPCLWIRKPWRPCCRCSGLSRP